MDDLHRDRANRQSTIAAARRAASEIMRKGRGVWGPRTLSRFIDEMLRRRGVSRAELGRIDGE